jgi:hypothetical protein
MSSTLTDLTAATTWSGTDLFYALVGGNSRKIAAAKFLVAETSSSLAMQDSTTAQTFRLYRTFTDSSNYERLTLTSSSAILEITAETAGTGSDNLNIGLTPAGTGQLRFINPGAVATARIQCTSSSGYAAIDSYNSAGTQVGSFGYANSGVGGSLTSSMYIYATNSTPIAFTCQSITHRINTDGSWNLWYGTIPVSGGSTAQRLTFSNSASVSLGIYVGVGAPTVSAGAGSLYLRTDGSSTSTRLYVRTDIGTWTNVTTAA